MDTSSRARRTRRGPLALLLACVLLVTGCTPLILPESWAGIHVDGTPGDDGRYTDARFIYVAYRNSVFRIDTQTIPDGRPSERLIDWTAVGPNNAQMFAAPAVGPDGTVYVGSYDHTLYAFSPTAEPRTQNITGFAPPKTNDRLVGPAVVYNGMVYVGQGDRGIRAYDAETGSLRVSYLDTRHGVWGAPVIDAERNTLYFGSLDQNVYALDADTLLYQWQVPVGGMVGATPLLVDGILYVGTLNNEMVTIDTMLNPPQIVDRFTTEGWVWSTPVLRDGVLYFGDLRGNIYAIDASEPSDLRQIWRQHDANIQGGIRGQVAVVDGLVIAPYEGRTLQARRTDTGGVMWTSSPASEDRILGDVIVIDNQVIVTTQSENQLVVAHDLSNGGRLWSVRRPNQDDLNRITQTPGQR